MALARHGNGMVRKLWALALAPIASTVLIAGASAHMVRDPAVDSWYTNVYSPVTGRLNFDSSELDLTALVDGYGSTAPCADMESTATEAEGLHAPKVDLQVPWQTALKDFAEAGQGCVYDLGTDNEMRDWQDIINGLGILVSMDKFLAVKYGEDTGYTPGRSGASSATTSTTRPTTSTTTRTLPEARSSRPHVLSLAVESVVPTPAALSADGGTIAVVGKVQSATSCQLKLVSAQSVSIVYASNVRPCTSSFSAHITVGANLKATRRTIAFELVARHGKEAATGKFYVPIAGAFSARVLSVKASPPALGAGGGAVWVTAKVMHATTCGLRLVPTDHPYHVVYSERPKRCTNGSYKERVVVGGNAGRAARTIGLELLARNDSSQSSGKFYVTVQGASPPQVVSVGATPETVRSGGGTVRVEGDVSHALVCRLRLLGSQGIVVAYYAAHKPCSLGSFSAKVSVGGNNTYVDKVLTFGLIATNKTSSSKQTFHIYVGARIFRAGIVIPTKRLTAGYKGGWVRVHFHVIALRANDCTVVLSEPGSGQAPAGKSFKCRRGNDLYSVWLPASKIARTFEVTINISGPHETSVSKSVTISQRAEPKSISTTTRPATTTTEGSTTTTRPRITTSTKPQSVSTTTTSPHGNYVMEVETDRPVAFWQMSETSGTMMRDSAAGHRHDGSYEGPVGLGETGPVSGARSVHFSGTDPLSTYAEYVPDSRVSGSFTVEQWVKLPIGALPCINGDARTLTTRGPTAYYGFFMCLGSDGARFGVGDGNSWLSAGVGTSFTPSPETWYMLDAVVSPTGGILYIDGARRATLTWTASTPLLWDTSHRVYIGSGTQNDGAGFVGDVGWTSVYSTDLSSRQIAAHWAAG